MSDSCLFYILDNLRHTFSQGQITIGTTFLFFFFQAKNNKCEHDSFCTSKPKKVNLYKGVLLTCHNKDMSTGRGGEQPGLTWSEYIFTFSIFCKIAVAI